MGTIKLTNGVKCWVRRQNCPCGELKCYIGFEEEEVGEGEERSNKALTLRKSEETASSLVVPVGTTDVEIALPYVGQTFYTDDDAFEYYSNFAKKNGFAIRRESSKSSQRMGTYRRELVCYRAGVARHRKSAEPERQKNRKSTLCGCEAKMTIVKEFFGTVPQWSVKRFSNNHNHELLNDDQLRLLPAYRKIPAADRERILLLRRAGYSTSHIMKMLGSDRGGGEQGQLPFIDRDVRNFIQSSSKKIDWQNDVSELLNLCKNEKHRNTDFIYSFNLDENDKLENLAWTYGESVRAYEVFGDVVVFDASYREIRYDMLLGVWFGVDNNGKTIFFAAVLLQDETSRSFAWALQSFLQFMKGRCPQTILTDLDLGLRDAVISEWPNARHSFCMWHIFSRLSSWFYPSLGARYEEFKFEFTRLYNLEAVKDFECQWNHMINCFGLSSNKHIVLLFSHRASWALSFIKGYFHGAMTAEFSKSIDAFLKEILSAQTCSESFFEKVATIVSSKNQVGDEEMEDVHGRTSMPIEEHAYGVLTPYAFSRLQQELMLSMHCAAFEMPNGLYLVRHHKQMDGGHLVSWTLKDERVHCSCKEFEFSGILCRHALRVLALKNYFHIPDKYLPIRWRRESSLVSKSTQLNSSDWCKAFHSLTATLFTESSMTKERIDYVQTELTRLLNHVRNMHGSDEIPLSLESTPQMDARVEGVANGSGINSTSGPIQSNSGVVTEKRKI